MIIYFRIPEYFNRRPLLFGVGLLSLSACGGQAELEWQEGDNLRWAELSVPRRGRDGFQQLSPDRTGVTFTNDVTEEQALRNEHLFRLKRTFELRLTIF